MTGNNLVFCVVITAILLTCMPVASASEEYTLGVFGNANEDDTIDLNDVEYTASVLLGQEIS